MSKIEGIPIGRVLVLGSGREGGKSMLNEIMIQLALQDKIALEIAEAEPSGVLEASGVSLSFDSMWLDDLEINYENKPVNAPYGPQPKGKKGKVRKW
jgi:hypothetical protein